MRIRDEGWVHPTTPVLAALNERLKELVVSPQAQVPLTPWNSRVEAMGFVMGWIDAIALARELYL